LPRWTPPPADPRGVTVSGPDVASLGPQNGAVRDPLDDLLGRYDAAPRDGDRFAPPDPLDAIVGSIDDDPVDDIDEVIYGR
jgi:hypothetical protein